MTLTHTQISPTAGPPRPERDFRRDIEGLRAVAVAVVILYHAHVPGFSGGYIGVDVFFVLSGFLITGLLRSEVERTGRISLSAFYGRRIRRLLAASCLVLVSTLLLARLVLSPLELVDLRADGVATALYVANFRFAGANLDYLNTNHASPVLQYWSLAVEEQFYLLWPSVILVATLLFRRHRERAILALLGVIVAVSLVASIVLTESQQPRAFFLLPSRAWEFGVGAALTFAVSRLRRIDARTATVAAWLGVGLILVAANRYSDHTTFPGLAALLPVVGTLLVLVGGTSTQSGGATRVLSTEPFQHVGRHSYSLYLWHWPLLVLAGVTPGSHPTVADRILPLLLAGALSIATFRVVENPIRRSSWLTAHRSRSLLLGLSLTLVGVGASFLLTPTPTLHTGAVGVSSADHTLEQLLANEPTTEVPANLRPSLLDVRADIPEIYRDGCQLELSDTTPLPCTFGDDTAATTIALFGDSHAAQWFPAIEQLAEDHHWRLISITKSGCPAPSLSIFNNELNRHYTECDTWRELALERLRDEAPALIITASFNKGQESGGVVDPAAWLDGWQTTIDAFPPSSAVLMIGDTPFADIDPPDCLSAHLRSVEACASRLTDGEVELGVEERELVEAAGGRYLPIAQQLCRDSQCPAIVGDLLVYRDRHHVTATMARYLTPALESPIQRQVGSDG